MRPQKESKERQITQDVFDQLVHYLKYASSAYSPLCLRPNGSALITHILDGFVARDDHRKELVVALRGSANPVDILLDTQVLLVPFLSPGVSVPDAIRVHNGFLVGWDSVSVQVLAILAEQLAFHKDIKRIVTCGHSLGGALATLAAISAKQHFPQCEIAIYSFGSPRTGNKAFAEFVNENFGENAFRGIYHCIILVVRLLRLQLCSRTYT